MALPEQKKKLLKAKIAVALQSELGRVPTEEEINDVFLYARVMYKAWGYTSYDRSKRKRASSLFSRMRELYANRIRQGFNP
jgi:hypothetical protein